MKEETMSINPDTLTKALDAAERRGAERMREEAARQAQRYFSAALNGEQLASAIRAMPLPGDKG